MHPIYYLRSLLFSLACLVGMQYGFAQGLSVAFPSDSLYVCQDSSQVFEVAVKGAQGGVEYFWQDGSTDPTWLLTQATQDMEISVQVWDGSGDTVQASVWLTVLPECVLPGDADGNRVANNYDLLAMGLAFGQIGPVRPDAHTQFVGQAAPAWGVSSPLGPDLVHGDADGDGAIGFADTDVIGLNYQYPQDIDNSLIDYANGVPVAVELGSSQVFPGDTVHLLVLIGDSLNPANDFYGLAFSIDYSSPILDSAAIEVSLDGSWLGSDGSALASIAKGFGQPQQIDIGITRLNGVAVMGYGLAADITVIIDDISGKKEGVEKVEFKLANLLLLDENGDPVPVAPISEDLLIDYSNGTANIQKSAPENDEIRVYPQPARENVMIEFPASFSVETFQLWDVAGKKLPTVGMLSPGELRLDVSTLPPGLVFLTIATDKSTITRRIVIR